MAYLVLVEVVRRQLMRPTPRHGPRNLCGETSHASIIGSLMQEGTIVEGMR